MYANQGETWIGSSLISNPLRIDPQSFRRTLSKQWREERKKSAKATFINRTRENKQEPIRTSHTSYIHCGQSHKKC